MHFLAVYRNVVKKTVNIISGKNPFTFLFLKWLDDYMSEGKECNKIGKTFYLREDVKNLSKN
jgi:hypothetical protein